MEKSIEKIYQKKTQLEHILLRPDTYVGSSEKMDQLLWIFDEKTQRFKEKKIDYVPALYKIFDDNQYLLSNQYQTVFVDEILVNAADNIQRDAGCTQIKVNINQSKNIISVYNNGESIPVVIHKTHLVYVPELIFGHLLTSSNYDDSEKKLTGGRNGFGAKLTNIFSKKFTIEVGDSKRKLLYKQEFNDNLSKIGEPTITSYPAGKNDYFLLTFQPDLKRFGMKVLEDDIVSLMKKRVYDLAGITSKSVKVYFNDQKIEIASFEDYVNLYFSPKNQPQIFHDKFGPRWEICVIPQDTDQFQQVSFVNSICTIRGGTHVNHVSDQITSNLLEVIQKKHKKLELKPYQIKSHLWIFVNALIENPAFDSQTKETLTSRPNTFGSKCQITDKFLLKIAKSGIIEDIVQRAEMKETLKLKKELGTGVKKKKLFGIPKLEDANLAGTPDSESCTLILTEGDSAKSLAMSGIQVVGRDKYGVFPLRGKLLNVRDANNKQILDNEEIQNIIKILGLYIGKDYTDLKSLRYGSVMIMADQDHDGSHIKGLIINFLHHFWPSLIKKFPNFVKVFITPIIKATKENEQQQQFFTISEYEKWASSKTITDLKKYKIKYYKGLGTSTAAEAKQYFTNIKKHQINFYYKDNRDEDRILLAFSKLRVYDRKDWLRDFNPNVYIDYNKSKICYSEFIDQELIHFSIADNMRSIPQIMDGLKPGQRKILFGCFKRQLKSEIKVAQISGYIAEHTAYHHGEVSLQATIVNMAQDYVGTNNLNLLQPIGQFGTRMMGGRDSASARYIFTNLSPLARVVFNENDDPLLNYQIEEGLSIEPNFYVPIVPMILINGAEGIGTGWSTYIPCYSPIHIIHNIKRHLDGKPFLRMIPWYKGFTGNIQTKGDDDYLTFTVSGLFEVDKSRNKITITELPLLKWTRDYKNFLEELAQKDEIIDIKEFHQDNTVRFEIKCHRDKLNLSELNDDQIEKKFKLTSNLNCTNLVLFNHKMKIQKYENECEILEEFFDYRLQLYDKRKSSMLKKLKQQFEKLSNKYKFIQSIINGSLDIYKKKKEEVVKLLREKGFQTYQDIYGNQKQNLQAISGNDLEKQNTKDSKFKQKLDKKQDYNYLLDMKIYSFVEDQLISLQSKMDEFEIKKKDLERKTPQDLWRDDLDQLQELYENTLSSYDRKITKEQIKIRHKEYTPKYQDVKISHNNSEQKFKQQLDREEVADQMDIDETMQIQQQMPKPEHRIVTKVSNTLNQEEAKETPIEQNSIRSVSLKKNTDQKTKQKKVLTSDSESEFEDIKPKKSSNKKSSVKSVNKSKSSTEQKQNKKTNSKKRTRKDREDYSSSSDEFNDSFSDDESSFSDISDGSEYQSKTKRQTRSTIKTDSKIKSKVISSPLSSNSKITEKMNQKQKDQEEKKLKTQNDDKQIPQKQEEQKLSINSLDSIKNSKISVQQKLQFQQPLQQKQGTLDSLINQRNENLNKLNGSNTTEKENKNQISDTKPFYELSLLERVEQMKIQSGTSSTGRSKEDLLNLNFNKTPIKENAIKQSSYSDSKSDDKEWVNIGIDGKEKTNIIILEDQEDQIPIRGTKKRVIIDDDE